MIFVVNGFPLFFCSRGSLAPVAAPNVSPNIF